MLIWVAVLLIGIGAAIAAGLATRQSANDMRKAAQTQQALQWAEQALIGFAARQGRLPCPAVDKPGGAENCASGNVKGWLPAVVKTPDAVYPPVRYMVYRNPASELDLARSENNYGPRKDTYSHLDKDRKLNKEEGSRYTFEHSNVNDLCEKLQRGSPLNVTVTDPSLPGGAEQTFTHKDLWRLALADETHSDTGHAYIVDEPAGRFINVAYGLAIDGAGAESGANVQKIVPMLESSARGHSATYTSTTRAMDFNRLAEQLGCSARLASLDTMAVFVSVAESVQSAKVANYEGTKKWAAIFGVRAYQSTIGTIMTTIGLLESITELSKSILAQVEAVLVCAATLGLSCADVPRTAFAVVLNGIAVGTDSANLITGTIATSTEIHLLAIYARAAAKAGHSIDMTMLNPETASEEICAQPEQLQETIDQLLLERDNLQNEYERQTFYWSMLDNFFKHSPHYAAQIQPTIEAHARHRYDVELRREEKDAAQNDLDALGEESFDYDNLRQSLIDAGADNVDELIAEMRASNMHTLELQRQTAQEAYDLAASRLATSEQLYVSAFEAAQRLLNDVALDVGGNPTQGYYLTYCPDLHWTEEEAFGKLLATTVCRGRLAEYEKATYSRITTAHHLHQLDAQISSTRNAREKAIESCEMMRNIVAGETSMEYSVWQGATDILRQATELDGLSSQ
jgi:hypothetical protein